MIETLSQQFRRASGRTSCDICGNTIPRGTRYLDTVNTCYERAYHWRECPICAPVTDAFQDDSDAWWADEGYGLETIQGYVWETLTDSLTPPGVMVTWWRHAHPGEPLPVEALLATEGVDQ